MCLDAFAEGIRLRLKVAPKAKRNALGGLIDEPDDGRSGGSSSGKTQALKISITAAPEDGKANAAVIALLAQEFGVAKSAISVVSGATDRRKIVEIRGQPAALMQKVQARLQGRQ